MAETRQGLKSKKPSSKTKSKPRRKASSKTAGKASTKASGTTKTKGRAPASEEKAAVANGTELLRRAAHRRLVEDSEELAGVIAGKALDGDLASTKMLLGLAERKKPQAEPETGKVTEPRGPSLADLLTSEPQWQEEPKEEENGEVKAEG
jgi:hypothetical protein